MLSPLAALLVSLVLIIIVVSKGYRDTGSWVFTGVLVCVGLWGFMLFGMRSSPDVETAVIWNRVAVIPATTIFVLYYHFAVLYTGARQQKGFVVAAYLLLLIVSILSPTNLILKEMRIADYGYTPVHGPLSPILSIILFPLLAGAGWHFIKAYRASNSYEERNRLLYLMIAILPPVVGAALDAFTSLPPMLVWGQVIFVILCSYAIFRFHLLDIRIIVRKSIAYLIISTLVALPYVAILFSLSRVVVFTAETIWYHALIILLLSMALQPLQQRAQQFVDRVFYRERYNYLLSLERLSRETQSVLDIDKLCTNLLQSLTGALKISKGCIFLRTADNSEYVVRKCLGFANPEPDTTFRKSGMFVQWLETRKNSITPRDFDIVPQLQSLPSGEKANILKLDAGIIAPILYQGSDQSELTGILALGEKMGQSQFSVEDRQLISTVANQIALSLENARLYLLERSMRETLEKTDAQKTEFLHTVAHELKTPLTAIMSSSEILEDGIPENEEIRKRLFNNINRSARIMNHRVTELVEMAKSQIGDIKVQMTPLEMKSVLIDSVSQLMVLFDNRHQKLSFDIPENLPPVEADKDKIQQVVFNLLANANKYSPENSRISLAAKRVDNYVHFEVCDSAPAISAENKEKIFTPYYRIEGSTLNASTAGLGLGLSISKKLVELHRGKIWVETNPQGGNVFVFSLPVANHRNHHPDSTSV